ncbi:MAG: DNA methyltransferase [Ignavibacteriota bacterium]
MRSPLNKTIIISEADKALPLRRLPKKISLDRSSLYLGDIMNVLSVLPEKSIDLVVADPPYNTGRNFGNESDRQDKVQYENWTHEWVSKLPRVLSDTASVYLCCDWKQSALFESSLRKSGLHILNRITWKREKGRGAARNWKQNMEDIWFAVVKKTKYTFNLNEVKVRKKVIAPYRENGKPKDWYVNSDGESERMTHPSNIWTDLTVPFWSMPENTEHPTQKPEALIERLIKASSNKGDLVLDLFSGSGTTSVVAQRLGRRYIGIEMNEDYLRLGLKRLKMQKKNNIK